MKEKFILQKTLVKSLGEKGYEEVKKPKEKADKDDLERLKIRNEIAGVRNENKRRIQELIKKESLEVFQRDLDDPESESRVYLTEINTDKGSEVFGGQGKDNKELKASEITVVIPMYNCADYVTGVLSMFVAQSFTDFEIICVIDGATDNTEELVSAFALNEPRLRYIVQENRGSGSARNTGLSMSRGEYIIFADADDEYFKNYLEKLYKPAVKHKAQIVTCLFNRINLSLHTNTVLGCDSGRLYENVSYVHSDKQ